MRPRSSKYDHFRKRVEPYAEFELAYRPHSYADVAHPTAAIRGEPSGDRFPPPHPGEVAIARVTYRTVVPHEVEIRARPTEDGFRYRIVDEVGSLFVPILDLSREPLSLGQLVDLIEESHGITGDPGLATPVLDAVFPAPNPRDRGAGETAGDRRARVDAVRGFVTVASDIYAELEELFQLKTDEWLVEREYLHTATRRTARLNREAMSTSQDPVEVEIDRMLRAWWMSHGGPLSDEEGIELGYKALQLRGYLREQAAERGRLPAGGVSLGGRDGGERWNVDLDGLVDTGTFLQRMLAEGEVLDAAEIEGGPFDPDYVSVYRFGDGLFIAHAAGVDGPFEEGDFMEDVLQEFFEDYFHTHAELVAQLDWDSGGPGAGAGISYVYRAFGALYISDDFGLSEPYYDYEHAVRHHGIYTVNGATTRIWDAEHGLVFEHGVLYKPEAVERYGEIDLDPTSLAPAPDSSPYPPGRDIAEGVMRRP
jgi:hypothetical protein